MADEPRELEHTEQHVDPGDLIKLRFPNDEEVTVQVVEISAERLVVSAGGLLLDFARVLVPYNLKGTSLGDVCGEFKMWKCNQYPDSSPAMIVANLGKMS